MENELPAVRLGKKIFAKEWHKDESCKTKSQE
jgi:hypothetical protein